MPPGRKKGANKEKAKGELSLGDLVLAKVKGYPFWPATISSPEDWDQNPEPKKYFVHFFGTEEIAFVAPVDIQAFTFETKTKLLARSQSKQSKLFSQAVKEICHAFEGLQENNSPGLRDCRDNTTVPFEDSSHDGVEISGEVAELKNELNESPCLRDRMDYEVILEAHSSHDGVNNNGAVAELNEEIRKVGSNEEIKAECLGDCGAALERCSNRYADTDCEDIKPTIPCKSNISLSPVISSKKDNKASNGTPTIPLKREVVLALCSSTLSPLKEVFAAKNVKSALQSTKIDSPNDGKKYCPSLNDKCCGDGQKSLTKDHRLRKMVTGSTGKEQGAFYAQESTSLKYDTPNAYFDPSHSKSKDGRNSKSASSSVIKKSSSNSPKSEIIVEGGMKLKIIMKVTKDSSSVDRVKRDSVTNSDQQTRGDLSGRKNRAHDGKLGFSNSKVSHPAKKVLSVDMVKDAIKRSRSYSDFFDVDDKTNENPEVKMSTLFVEGENNLESGGASKVRTSSIITESSGEEAVEPLAKRSRQTSTATFDSASVVSDNEVQTASILLKSKVSHSNDLRFPATQLRAKRRAVCIDDDDDDHPKTPLHGGFTKNINTSSNTSDLRINIDTHSGNSARIKSTGFVCSPPDDCLQSTKSNYVISSDTLLQSLEKSPRKEMSREVLKSPGTIEFVKSTSKEVKEVTVSLVKSPSSIPTTKPLVVEQKIIKTPAKVPISTTPKQAQNDRGSGLFTDISTQNQVKIDRTKHCSSGERSKTSLKTYSRITESAEVPVNSIDNLSFPDERFKAARGDPKSAIIDSKIEDSGVSMKHLIAVAQAKRRLADTQMFSLGNSESAFVFSTDPQGRTPSPGNVVQPSLHDPSILSELDAQGSTSLATVASPSTHAHQFTSQKRLDSEEFEERGMSPGHRAVGGSLSGGTEAAIARDSFEGMIETLSRTKESIGRATRLAIDCAKYGIASEVVELLIRKLESEPSFHRRIDLFFLVDSITQCSHSQKGIAGASYIPTVQAALPRLLGAAAPPGAGTRENRRQCLKVMRLWLERKILPEHLLRRCMSDLGGSNDDKSAGYFQKRPSRAERAVDDPIREMEGMLVDEYGSNATFQLPGFLSSYLFKDEEEDIPASSSKIVDDMQDNGPGHALEDIEFTAVTPNDRRHCILEDVDGELEMEDVCATNKDEPPIFTNHYTEKVPLEQKIEGIGELSSNSYTDLPPCPDGSPPLPLDSPPPPPPLPPSPPPSPPSPPPLSPTPPPPPPFPSHSSYLPLPPAQSSVPPPLLHPLPSQPSLLCQPFPFAPQSSPQLAYIPHEYCSTSGNQRVPMAGTTPSSQSYQQLHPDNIPFAQRPLCPAPPSQTPSSQFSYATPTIQQHPQHTYPRPYSLSSLPDEQRRFVANEPWRLPYSDVTDNHLGVWTGVGKTPSCSGPSFIHEGYLRQPIETPPINNIGVQHFAPNAIPTGAPIQGHAGSQMLPHGHNISAINGWRPA